MSQFSNNTLGLFSLCAVCCILVTSAMAQETPVAELTASEQRFVDLLDQTALVGHFSIDGKDLNDLKKERYEIESVKKFKDDLWTFNARIKYGNTDLKIPMVLKVVWADDTPMISMTDVQIPGLGTFTARVIFYGDRYAGTWQHGAVGGHMWGSLEDIPLPEESDAESKK